jgi:hypothetical protein
VKRLASSWIVSRRLAAVLALSLASAPFLSAVNLKVEQLSFLPARFRVGEEVELRAEVLPEGGTPEAFSLKAGSGLPLASGDSDLELKSLSLSKSASSWELKARFVAWVPGSGQLAPLSVHGVSIPALAFDALSALGPGDRDLDPPKPQRDPPGTEFYLYGFVGLLALLALAGLGIATYVLPGARALVARWKAAQARRNLERSLAFLEGSIGEVETAAFYAALARALRLYLAARILPEAPMLTPRELGLLPEERFPAQGIREEAAAALAETDEARFGGGRPSLSAMKSSIERAEAIGAATEEALDAGL